MQAPAQLDQMYEALKLIAEQVAQWEVSATRERRVVDVGTVFTLDEQSMLARFRALRGCCEAALTCAEDNNLVARQQTRAALSRLMRGTNWRGRHGVRNN